MSACESTPDTRPASDQILPRELTDAEKEALANDTKLVPEFWRKKYEKVHNSQAPGLCRTVNSGLTYRPKLCQRSLLYKSTLDITMAEVWQSDIAVSSVLLYPEVPYVKFVQIEEKQVF